MLNIAVILGSTRDGRFGEKPARWIFDELGKRKGVAAAYLDLRDYPMPHFDQAVSPAYAATPYEDEAVARWTAKIAEQDGFVVVAPEYNRSVGGAMKNAFDWVYREWNRKAIGFVGYGGAGGARAVEHMRLIAVELQMAPVRQGVHVAGDLYMSLAKHDAPVDPTLFASVQKSADVMLDQVIWWADALKSARAGERERKAA